MLDIAFINARIVDGTGTPWQRGCVGVHDGRIVQVGSNGDLPEAANVIDVDDHVLCPGFIDSHSHSDLSVLENPESSAKIMQGVTTENVGLDSLSVAPISDGNKEQWQISLSGLDGILNRAWDWNSFSSYLDRVDAAMPSVNISSYVGLGTVRLDVMGMENRPPTAAELRRMKEVHRGVHAAGRARHIGWAHLYAKQVPVHGGTDRAGQNGRFLRRSV